MLRAEFDANGVEWPIPCDISATEKTGDRFLVKRSRAMAIYRVYRRMGWSAVRQNLLFAHRGFSGPATGWHLSQGFAHLSGRHQAEIGLNRCIFLQLRQFVPVHFGHDGNGPVGIFSQLLNCCGVLDCGRLYRQRIR